MENDPKKEESEVGDSIQEGVAPSLEELSPLTGEPVVPAPEDPPKPEEVAPTLEIESSVPPSHLIPELQVANQVIPTDRKICGARKSNGTFCMAYPLIGFTRCRIHGGASAKAAFFRREKETRDKWSNIYSVVEQEKMSHLTLFGGPKYVLDGKKRFGTKAKQLADRIQRKVNHINLGDLSEEVAIISCMVEDHLLDLVNPNKHLEDEMRLELTKIVRSACKDLASVLTAYHQIEKERRGVLTKEKAKAMMLEFMEVFLEYVHSEEEKMACVRKVDTIAKKYL